MSHVMPIPIHTTIAQLSIENKKYIRCNLSLIRVVKAHTNPHHHNVWGYAHRKREGVGTTGKGG